MHAEVLVVCELAEDGIGNPADAHLQRRAVGNETRDSSLAISCASGEGISHCRIRQRVVYRNHKIDFEMWMNASPSVRGMCGFTSAITILADCAAAFVTPTSTPNEQNPCSSA